MTIVDLDEEIVSKLRNSRIAVEMKNLESCDWIVYEEQNGKIIGTAGVGELFHVS